MTPKLKKIIIIMAAIIAILIVLIAIQFFTPLKPYTRLKEIIRNYQNAPAKNYRPSTHQEPNAYSGPDAAKNLNIFIQNSKFTPNFSAMPIGSTVTWYNNDSVVHTVTSDNWDSGQIPPGGKFSKTFDSAGDNKYHCTIHPSMTGELIIK